MSQAVMLRAVDPIRHDGRDYPAGAVFPVSPAAAEALLGGGAAVVSDAIDATGAAKTPKKPAKATKQAGVAEGITDPEKTQHNAGATAGNGGSE